MRWARALPRRRAFRFSSDLSRSHARRRIAIAESRRGGAAMQATRESVLADLEKLVIAPAFGCRLPGVLDDGAVHIGDLPQTKRDAIAQPSPRGGSISSRKRLCSFRRCRSGRDGHLEPRPFMLRVFAARTADGWQVLPGGFCQVSASLIRVRCPCSAAIGRRCLGAVRSARRPMTLLSSEASLDIQRIRDICRRAMRKICSGSGVISSARKTAVRLVRAR